LLERLRTHRAAFTLHETSASGRPFLLAGIYRALRTQLLVVVPTADIAERTFADLSYYLAEDSANLTLVRPREESVGVIESPSERSARMSLLADLRSGKPLLAVAPLAALRQYVMPRAEFGALSFTLETNASAGFDALQQRLYELGYHRSDVVAAAGEYAVRGGIVDLWTATAARRLASSSSATRSRAFAASIS
jgi:transcription-repair coupling factor (superfamily II helicase)